ncbi:MAG: response regulator [Acidobacteria bacterium]|nr:response regulator [Acidobacteriota bacterium]
MSLAEELMSQIADPAGSPEERARLRCALARRLEESGDYEAAREALGELWAGVGERPALDGLDEPAGAGVLLCVGVLTGWLGSARQLDGLQELAKDLIGESILRFEELRQPERVAEARVELAVCYWRQGTFDEARVLLGEVLRELGEVESEVRAVALIRSAIVERSAGRFDVALRIHTEAAPYFERLGSHSLKGRFHVGYANLLLFLSEAWNRADYLDRALLEFTAAAYHFEQAGHARYHACVENNLGYLFLSIGKYEEAHAHLDRARALFKELEDGVHLAQVEETRSRVLLAEGRVHEAEKLARAAVWTLGNGGEHSLLAAALNTHGLALSRLGLVREARRVLRKAVEIAPEAGDPERAGRAALTLIEELGASLSGEELSATYERAAELLSGSQNPATLGRLCACARRTLFLLGAHPAPPDWNGFSFTEAIRRFEAGLIEKALRDAGGQVTRAAQLLGIRYHNGLVSMLNRRHRNLLSERTPVLARRRSIIKVRERPGARRGAVVEAMRSINILHVEDNQMVAAAVKETLELEGWRVETCANGAVALGRVQSDAPFDALLFDDELPGMRGVEIVRRARALPRHRHTPMLMLSASDCESEARAAGVDAFLHKPQDVLALADTIRRLLAGVKEP